MVNKSNLISPIKLNIYDDHVALMLFIFNFAKDIFVRILDSPLIF